MICSQCKTELPDSAAICTTCGRSTQTNMTGTFSYLPPGTPSWPTTVPQGLPYVAGRTELKPAIVDEVVPKTATKPRRSLQSILLSAALLVFTPVVGVGLTLGSMYANGQFPPNAGSNAVKVTIQPTSTPANSTPTVQPTQLPTPTAFQKTNNTANIGVVLKYPNNWVEDSPQTSTSDVYVLLHPQQQSLAIIFMVRRFAQTATSNISNADN